MIVQEFTLEIIKWNVRVYYHPSWEDNADIIKYLVSTGCEDEDLDDIASFLEDGFLNTGCTYTNFDLQCSVLIISKTTGADQFNDTYDHEKGHLAMHICKYEGIDPFSEKYQYLTGEIGRKMFKAAKMFLCDHCRGKV